MENADNTPKRVWFARIDIVKVNTRLIWSAACFFVRLQRALLVCLQFYVIKKCLMEEWSSRTYTDMVLMLHLGALRFSTESTICYQTRHLSYQILIIFTFHSARNTNIAQYSTCIALIRREGLSSRSSMPILPLTLDPSATSCQKHTEGFGMTKNIAKIVWIGRFLLTPSLKSARQDQQLKRRLRDGRGGHAQLLGHKQSCIYEPLCLGQARTLISSLGVSIERIIV